jgi:hypothetical protein
MEPTLEFKISGAMSRTSQGKAVSWGKLERAKVLGGWFVVLSRENISTPTAFFYPDPNHEWDGRSLD